MDKIIVEDRTTETPDQVLEREVLAAGRLIAGFTVRVSGARPPVGLSALAYVLGMGAARTDAELDEVLDAVRKHFEGTRAAMAIEAGTEVLIAAAAAAVATAEGTDDDDEDDDDEDEPDEDEDEEADEDDDEDDEEEPIGEPN